jgi:hypothetical protein
MGLRFAQQHPKSTAPPPPTSITKTCWPLLVAPVAEARAWVGIGSGRTQWRGGRRVAARRPCWGRRRPEAGGSGQSREEPRERWDSGGRRPGARRPVRHQERRVLGWRETDRRCDRGTDAASWGTNVRLTAPGCTGSSLGYTRAGGSRAASESYCIRAKVALSPGARSLDGARELVALVTRAEPRRGARQQSARWGGPDEF